MNMNGLFLKKIGFQKMKLENIYLQLQMALLFVEKNLAILYGGVNDATKEVVWTTVNFNKYIDNEPYKHYLARNLTSKISLTQAEFTLSINKRNTHNPAEVWRA